MPPCTMFTLPDGTDIFVLSELVSCTPALSMTSPLKFMVPLIVPLFMAAIRRAEDLAMAMEARCYHGGEGRTEMKPLSMKRRDYMAVVLAAVYLAAVLVLRFAV